MIFSRSLSDLSRNSIIEEQEWSTYELFIYVIMFIVISVSFNLLPSRWMEIITAEASSLILSFIGLESEAGFDGNWAYLTLYGERLVNVSIVRECTGIHVWGIIAGLVIPLKYGDWTRKLLSLSFGAILVVALNLSRILLTVYFTAFDILPLSWFFRNPTVKTYHYPISFIYGVLGIMIIIITIDRLILRELGSFLASLPKLIYNELNKLFNF